MGIFRKERVKIRPVVILVLDGFGLAPSSPGNAITQAKTPNFDWLFRQYPSAELVAAGESVGLPANEDGNSEVGHLTIGAGRTIKQSLLQINNSIEDGSFYDNKAFLETMDHIKKHQSHLHILGLASSGNVHASIEHLNALIEFCKRNRLADVRFHLFTDGRDAPPKDGINIIRMLEEKLLALGIGKIATVAGRYYGMDRDGRWERTKRIYDAITLGTGTRYKSASDALETCYKKGLTDEFVEPSIIAQPDGNPGTVADNDAVIFFNFRKDRPRQLTMSFIFPNFEYLDVAEYGYEAGKSCCDEKDSKVTTFIRKSKPNGVYFVTMSEYQDNFPVSAVAFPPKEVENSLPEVISKMGLRQLHMAETEKERMVSFYFNGLRESPFANEETIIVPSPNVATYDKKPEMSVMKLLAKFKSELKKDKFHFYVINFANPDMVAHTGNLGATIKAIEYVDRVVGEMSKLVTERAGVMYITADHGNAEELLTFPQTGFFITTSSGVVNTEHSNYPVPFLVIDPKLKGRSIKLPKGSLCDVAPTVLARMGVAAPYGMTGRDLLSNIN